MMANMLIEIYISLAKRSEKHDLSVNERGANDECEKSSCLANVPEHIG